MRVFSGRSRFRGNFTVAILLAAVFTVIIELGFVESSLEGHGQKYFQVPESDGLYYYPRREIRGYRRPESTVPVPVYMSSDMDDLGKDTILLQVDGLRSTADENVEQSVLFLFRKSKVQLPHVFVYDALELSNIERELPLEVAATAAELVPVRPFGGRGRRKRSIERVRTAVKDAFKKAGAALFRRGSTAESEKDGAKKIIVHLPALFIDEEKDGFEHVFYRDMIVSSLCLTNQPDLDRHEIRDEYEARVCNNKGYAAILPESARKRSIPLPQSRMKRDNGGGGDGDIHFHDHDPDNATFHLDKNKYDILWRNENVSTSSSTNRPAEPEIVEDLDYDYEFEEDEVGNLTTGWEAGDHELDPADLDFIVWPAFLPVTGEEKVNKSDQLRSKLHNHPDRNYSLNELYILLQENHTEIEFDRLKFALNESTFLADYYTSAFHLWSYSYEGLIKDFFTDRNKTLSTYTLSPQEAKITLESIRELFILFIIDVHHVNCFNRHIRFYGYVMKKPASINGDEITNNGRLTRGIVMRALELLRHVPQYNAYKELFLRMLIASLKERAGTVKHSTKLVEENDYTELFEVAKYLEYLLQNGIHPDEKNQDLFVQETRFYAHHFMNTMTL